MKNDLQVFNGGPKVFTGNANPVLAQAMCDYLKIPMGKAEVFQFSNENIFVRIQENIRQRDVFIVQSISTPVNTSLVELLIMIDAAKRASAGRITAVLPFYGYGRTDKKDQPRVPITARLLADLITTAGADRLLTMDLHAGQIQGFFNIPVDNLFATPVLLDVIRRRYGDGVVIISPDAGGVERSRAYAKRLGVNLAIIDKRREAANVSEVMNIVGDVKDRTCVIVDDIVDTAGTLAESAIALEREGAEAVAAVITHPVLSGPAIKRILESPLHEMVVTDSIPLSPDARDCDKLHVVSIAPLLSEAIRRINNEESVSSLFI